ncbi:MAG: helix-turn-helix transcriptional regulator [Bacteroidales bacterium]|nr:helix-turn-helix transcriptional regulator [Bacteroidales bacterium]
MGDLICDNYPMLFVMSRFGILPGFGEKTIEEVCLQNNVHTQTFLSVVNMLISGKRDPHSEASLTCLVQYLHNSHSHFLDIRLPSIRKKLLKTLGTPIDRVSKAVIRFYDEYVEQVQNHMAYEEQTVFPYVRSLLQGDQSGDYCIRVFCNQHDSIETKLSELKNILIKYYPTGNPHELNNVLFDIFACAQDLASHNYIEDNLFVPMISRLEGRDLTGKCLESKSKQRKEETSVKKELSKREKEVIVEVAKGLTNKEIADKLFISVHTVMTHRKNIAGKLQIHSPSGLTIYAILNNLVDLDDVKK